MKRPLTCVNLIKAIGALSAGQDPVRLSRAVANVIVAQMLSDGVVKGGSSLLFRYGRFSMISSVNNQGKCYWMIIDGVFNADRLIVFMGSLAKDAPRKVFLVMDNLKVHHCKPVKEWLEKNRERIEVFYLPSYSPELNPNERLNADLKHAITTSVPRRTRQGLLKKTTEHMKMVKASPERVKTYFKDKHVAYAADSQ